MNWKRTLLLVVAGAMAALLSACSPVGSASSIAPVLPTEIPCGVTTPCLEVETATEPVPTQGAPEPVSPIPGTPLAPTFTPAILVLTDSTPEFEICSPLAWETLPELSEIVGDPYSPPPPERAEERHHGVDFSHYGRKGHASILGESVQAVLAGVVAASITDRLPYGNMVIIETSQDALPAELRAALELLPDESLYLLYAHLQAAPLVELGETVTCGQVLGTVGKTGYNIVNEHLHLETRRGPAGERFESMAFYTSAATPEEMANYLRWRTGGEFVHFNPFLLLNASFP